MSSSQDPPQDSYNTNGQEIEIEPINQAPKTMGDKLVDHCSLKFKFYAKYTLIGTLSGILGYKYLMSILDFREMAEEMKIETRYSSDLIWMLLAAAVHHAFKHYFKKYFAKPITELVKKNNADANPNKTMS
jgi:hypothetical protein